MDAPIALPLSPHDYADWLPLWTANMDGAVADDITQNTWSRICDPASPVNGLCVRLGRGGPMAGICHFILHPTTGTLHPVCYMQDLYVDPAHRRMGIARMMVQTLAALGESAHWTRIYWLAEAQNDAAQSLYRDLGVKLDFSLHVWPLGRPR